MADNINDVQAIMLTKSQIDNLIEFFEMEFINSIQKDEDLDNIFYLCEMCDIYKQLKAASAKMDGGEGE